MEFQQKHSKRKITLIILGAALAIAIAFVGVYVGALKKPLFGWPKEYAETQELSDKNIDTTAPTDEEKQAGDQAKSDTIEKNQQSTETPSPSNPIQVTLTASGKNGDIYQLRYLIDSSVTSGTCKLTLTKGSQTVAQEAPVQVLGGSSTCAGFNIPISSLSAGDWKAVNTVTGNDRTGTNTEIITI